MSDEKPSDASGDQVPQPPKPRKKLTRRQEKLAREKVRHPNDTLEELGARSAYMGGKGSVGRELKKPHVQDRIRELLNAHPDTSLEGLTATLRQGLKASTVKVFHSDLDGISYATPLVDHPTRHRFMETGLELHGALDKRPRGPDQEDPPLSLKDALAILLQVQVTVNLPPIEPRP